MPMRSPACLFVTAIVMLVAVFAPAQQPATTPSLPVPINDSPPVLRLPGAAQPVDTTAPAASGATPAVDPSANKHSSTSGQFVIHGSDLSMRTWFGQQCDEISSEVKRLLRDSREGGIPIVIALKADKEIRQGEPPVRASFAQLNEGGFHLQLTVQLVPELNTTVFRDELIRMLLAERILRDHNELTTKRTRILPDWLLVGVKEGLRFRKRVRPSALFATVFKSGKVYGIEEILDISPTELNTVTRTIYEISCCALVLTLLEQPEGGLRMGKFLNSLATDNGTDRELINRWFPGIAQSKASLEKWWSLQMASLSRPSVFETMGPEETSKALDQALTLRFMVEPGNEPAPTIAKKTEEPAAAESEEDKPRTFLARWFSRSKEGENEDLKDTKKPEKKAEKKAEAKPLTDEEMASKKGFLGRLFGSDEKPAAEADSKKKPDEKKPAPKPEPKKTEKPAEPTPAKKPEPEKPKDKPAANPKDEEPKRPGLLRRLFTSDKTTEDAPKDEAKPKSAPKKAEEKKTDDKKSEDKKTDDSKPEPKKDTAPAIKPIGQVLLKALLPRSMAALELATALNPTSGAHYTFLGFGKKKDADKDKPEDAKGKEKAKPETDAKAKDKPKAEPKKDDKKEEKKPEKKEPPKEDKPVPQKEVAAKPAAKKLVPASLPLEDYARVLKRPDARQILASTLTELNAVQQYAHIAFRPVIAEYIQVVVDLTEGKTKDIEARLKSIKAHRAGALAKGKELQTMLDTYEANNSSWSGLLDDFLRAEQTVEESLPKGTDPISIWFQENLDKYQREQGTKR